MTDRSLVLRCIERALRSWKSSSLCIAIFALRRILEVLIALKDLRLGGLVHVLHHVRKHLRVEIKTEHREQLRNSNKRAKKLDGRVGCI